MVTCLRETRPAATDRDSSLSNLLFDLREPGLEDLNTALFLEALGLGGVAAGLAVSRTDWEQAPSADAVDPALKAPTLAEEVAEPELPGVLRGPG